MHLNWGNEGLPKTSINFLHYYMFKIKSVRFHQIINTFYSNLPYAVFNTALIKNPKNKKINQKLFKFKWRNTLVALRAPKHFKVARQHYSKGARIIKLTLHAEKQLKNPNKNTTCQNLQQTVQISKKALNSTTYNIPSLTITKTKIIKSVVVAQFKII